MVRTFHRSLLLFAGGILMAGTAFCAANAASSNDSGSSAPAGAVMCCAADSEGQFLTDNQRAMDRMMAGMAAKPTGNVDADFAAMMIPHHQGAIDMAVLELRYGHNEQLRRIAQEIIVDQQQEIAAMRLALGQALPPSIPAPTDTPGAPGLPARPADHSMEDMPK